MYFSGTIEGCLGYSDAQSIHLVGQESVEGFAAWHIQVQSKYGEALNFWIDVAQPTRVLKQSVGNDWAVSKYDEATPRDPIPIEVTAMNSYQNGSFEIRHTVRPIQRTVQCDHRSGDFHPGRPGHGRWHPGQ